MPEPIVTRMGWDWKSRPSSEELVETLKPFGLFVYEDPSCEGTDGYGYFVSSEKLSPEDLNERAEMDY